jgi:hypothetical protein
MEMLLSPRDFPPLPGDVPVPLRVISAACGFAALFADGRIAWRTSLSK